MFYHSIACGISRLRFLTMLLCCLTFALVFLHLMLLHGRTHHHQPITRNVIENLKILKININEKDKPKLKENRASGDVNKQKLTLRKYNSQISPSKNKSFNIMVQLTRLQRRAKSCTFYDPLIKKSNPILCGAENFVSIVRSGCRTRLGNQLSAYAAIRYFQHKFGMTPLLLPFQMKIIKSVFNDGPLSVRSLNLDFCCNDRTKWKTIMALKEDKRTGIATGLNPRFEKNPEYYSRNFLVELGHHTMPLFLFKGKYLVSSVDHDATIFCFRNSSLLKRCCLK